MVFKIMMKLLTTAKFNNNEQVGDKDKNGEDD